MLNLLQVEQVVLLILWEASTQDAASCGTRREGKGAEVLGGLHKARKETKGYVQKNVTCNYLGK